LVNEDFSFHITRPCPAMGHTPLRHPAKRGTGTAKTLCEKEKCNLV
jgi:hypothetical protein